MLMLGYSDGRAPVVGAPRCAVKSIAEPKARIALARFVEQPAAIGVTPPRWTSLAAKTLGDVVFNDLFKFVRNAVAAERLHFSSVDKDQRWSLARSGSEIPISACFNSPGPFTMHPMTATLRESTPG